MTNDQLNNEYQNLSQECLDLLHNDDDVRLDDLKKWMDYIDRISEYRKTETTFTYNKDEKTVIIKTRKGSVTAPIITIT